MRHFAIRHRKAHYLLRSKNIFVILDSLRRTLNDQVGCYRMVCVGNGFHVCSCHKHSSSSKIFRHTTSFPEPIPALARAVDSHPKVPHRQPTLSEAEWVKLTWGSCL